MTAFAKATDLSSLFPLGAAGLSMALLLVVVSDIGSSLVSMMA